MNQKQNNVLVSDISSNEQETKQSPSGENREIREYYLRQLCHMCPTIGDKSDGAKLVILHKRIARLVEMLTLFEHSWAEEIPVLQKACLSHLATESLPRKERQQIIDAWVSWSDFLFQLAHYRGLLSQFLQYHHRERQELEDLLNMGDKGISTRSFETGQEGGI